MCKNAYFWPLPRPPFIAFEQGRLGGMERVNSEIFDKLPGHSVVISLKTTDPDIRIIRLFWGGGRRCIQSQEVRSFWMMYEKKNLLLKNEKAKETKMCLLFVWTSHSHKATEFAWGFKDIEAVSGNMYNLPGRH